jgi:hypothetical protein
LDCYFLLFLAFVAFDFTFFALGLAAFLADVFFAAAFSTGAFAAALLLYFKATCAAASLAIGTRNGEQLT